MSKSFQEREEGRQEALKALAKHHKKVRVNRLAKEKISKVSAKPKLTLKQRVEKGFEKRAEKRKKQSEAAYAPGILPKERAKIVKKQAVQEREEKEKRHKRQQKTHDIATPRISRKKKK